MQPLIPPTQDDLVAAQLRLATAKDLDDEAQADLRRAMGVATSAKKEQASALRGWRQILRQMDVMPDESFDPGDEDDEPDEGDVDEGTLDDAERAAGFDGPAAEAAPVGRKGR